MTVPDTPTLAEALQSSLDARASQIRTAMPARVISYDRMTQVADVRPEVWPDGEEAPIVPTVPVLWPRGSNAYLHFDLTPKSTFLPGDTGLLVCCEADISEWRRTGQPGAPADQAAHHLQNAVYIPGLVPRDEVLAPGPAGAAVLDGAGMLLLGDSTAGEAAVLGSTFMAALDVYLLAQIAWVNGVAAIVGGGAPALAATFVAAIGVLRGALPNSLSLQVWIR